MDVSLISAKGAGIRCSKCITIYKNMGDAQSCTNNSGIKRMNHSMKMWERVIESKMRGEVIISVQQYGFTFASKVLAKKYREGQKNRAMSLLIWKRHMMG